MVVRRVYWQATLAVLGMLLAISALVRLAESREAEGQALAPAPLSIPSATVVASVVPTIPSSPASPTPTAGIAPTSLPKPESAPPAHVWDLHVEAVVGQPEYINPILAQHSVDYDLVSLIFDGLTKAGERFQIVPDLAREWEISDDGRVYTFELRRDVVWHDGAPFTADDVVFTVQAIQQQYYQGPANLANLWRAVEVEKVNSYSVRFSLQEPFSPFLSYTTVGILPAHLLDSVPAALLPQKPFNLLPVGTGPFKIAEVHLDEGYLMLEANPAYFNPPPRMDRLEFQFYPSQASIFAAYGQGAVTGIGSLPVQGPRAVRDYPSLTLYNAPLSKETFIFLNLNHSNATFLADRNVREALLLGLDRQELIDKELGGQGIVACSMVPPYSWAHRRDLPCYDYNPRAASALLDETGWVAPRGMIASVEGAPGQGSEEALLGFSLLVDGGNVIHLRLADEIVRQWAKIGVRVEVDPELSHERLQSGRYMAALVECELPADPDPYPLWHSTQANGQGQNYTGFSNRESDQLMEEGRQVADLDRRTEIYGRLQEVWALELPALPLYYSVYNYALDRQIEGVQLGLMLGPSDRFRNVSQWYLASSEQQAIP